MTKGESRIRTTFNPSGVSEIDSVKQNFAGLIDLLDKIEPKSPEQSRLIAIAQTRIEEAAMWAVKALTA